jgi:hypothetical protein
MQLRQVLHDVRRVLSLPPHVVVQKVVGRAKRHWHDWVLVQQDVYRSTYLKDLPFSSSQPFRYLDGLPCDFSCSSSSVLPRLADHFLKHRFDLLGSGWVEVRHGIECRGVEGHRYDMGVNISPDTEGQWLAPYINAANLRESRRVWSLVDSGYIPIDWQLDFKSGFRWSQSHWYKYIPFVHTGHKPGVDIKVPWELARMQHLPLLAYAYGLASKGNSGFELPEVYSREFRNQILDFIATNPPRFGVNWACTMDVAIRAANWLVAYDLLNAFGARFDSEFDREFLRSIYQHGLHIVANLEWNPELVGNHYLADLVGLLFVAAYLPRRTDTDAWLAFSIQELVREVGHQFLPDGANFEASTSYHRLSAEMVTFATALALGLPEEKIAALNHYDHRCLPFEKPQLQPAPFPFYPLRGTSRRVVFPDWYLHRLESMADFTMHITKPDGGIPQFGDNDNGRLLKLTPVFHQHADTSLADLVEETDEKAQAHPMELVEDHLDHRHLIAAINGLFQRNDFAVFAGTDVVDSLVVRRMCRAIRLPSSQCAERAQHGEGTPGPSPDMQEEVGEKGLLQGLVRKGYPQFGLYLYVSRRLYLAIRCGSVGQDGHGGHAHNDSLSFELSLAGYPIVVDSGTYMYTPNMECRNQFRSTRMHNTLSLQGKEQNMWQSGRKGLFQLPDHAQAKALEFGARRFVGEHGGFGHRHRRTLELTADCLRGLDVCDAPGVKSLRFHLASGIAVQIGEDGADVQLAVKGVRLLVSATAGVWTRTNSTYSPGYGAACQSMEVQLQTEETSVEWVIRPTQMD